MWGCIYMGSVFVRICLWNLGGKLVGVSRLIFRFSSVFSLFCKLLRLNSVVLGSVLISRLRLLFLLLVLWMIDLKICGFIMWKWCVVFCMVLCFVLRIFEGCMLVGFGSMFVMVCDCLVVIVLGLCW